MSRNNITGDRITSRPASDEFRAAFDRIFGKSERIPAPTMICPQCGVDRFKDGCAKWPCAMTGTAYGEADRAARRERRREVED